MSPEQDNLGRLLLSAQAEQVALGITLLQQQAQPMQLIRALGLLVLMNPYHHPVGPLRTWLETRWGKQWHTVRQELALMEWVYYRTEAMEFEVALAHYTPHRTVYEHYMRFNPTYAEWYTHLNIELHYRARHVEELHYLAVLLELYPEEVTHYQRYAYALRLAGHPWAAQRPYLEQAAQLPNTQAEDCFRLGLALQQEEGDNGQALFWIEKGMQLDPTHLTGHGLMAQMYALQGNWAKAEQWYQKAFELAPHDPELLHQYAHYWLFYRKDGPAAEPYARRAVEESYHEMEAYQLTLARVYWYGLKDAQRARQIVGDLVEAGCQDPILVELQAAIDSGNTILPKGPT